MVRTKDNRDRKCGVCLKEFKYPSHLKLHQQRKFPCEPAMVPATSGHIHTTSSVASADDPSTQTTLTSEETVAVCRELVTIPASASSPQCEMCRKTFSTRSNLLRHVKVCTSRAPTPSAESQQIQKLTEKVEWLTLQAAEPRQIIQNNTYNTLHVWQSGEPIYPQLQESELGMMYLNELAFRVLMSNNLTQHVEPATQTVGLFVSSKMKAVENRYIKLGPPATNTFLRHVASGVWVPFPCMAAADDIFSWFKKIVTDLESSHQPINKYLVEQLVVARNTVSKIENIDAARTYIINIVKQLMVDYPPPVMAVT